MKTWTNISDREKLRVKHDPNRFKELWTAQISNYQYVACVQMLESAICASKTHARVPIAEVTARTGLSVAEIARFLHERGGVAHEKLLANCPDSDPSKAELVSEMMTCSAGLSVPKRREDRHPWVLTRSFMWEVASANPL